MENNTDEQIARQLLRAGYLTSQVFSVWLAQHHGATVFSLRKDYRVHPSTLYEWVHKVNKAIADARLITAPEAPEKSPFGISVAESHHVHLASDPTPEGRKPRSMFPDAEQMKLYGKRPR